MAEHIVYEQDRISKVDMIHKIIDDAMAKKDRNVTIFITDSATSVHVSPYETGLQTWITIHEDTDVPYLARDKYSCPNCGALSNYVTPYCPYCGEQLKMEVTK